MLNGERNLTATLDRLNFCTFREDVLQRIVVGASSSDLTLAMGRPTGNLAGCEQSRNQDGCDVHFEA